MSYEATFFCDCCGGYFETDQYEMKDDYEAADIPCPRCGNKCPESDAKNFPAGSSGL